MRYFVYGYYGYANFGDDLLLRALVEGIRVREPGAQFLIHCRNRVAGYDDDRGVQFVPLARYLEGVRARPWRALAYLLAFARGVESTDTLIIGGGTLFIDKGRVNFSLILLLLAQWYARLRRRTVIVLGVSVDELTNPITRWVTSRIFAAAAFIAVRDDVSLTYAAHIPQEKVHRAADLVFGLPLQTPVGQFSRERPVVGLCFIDYFGAVETSPDKRSTYEAAILETIERNCGHYGFASIVLQRGIGQRDDWMETTFRRHYPALPTFDLDSLDAALKAFAEVDVVITTRYHLGVLALLCCKPVIVIDHELKMRSLAEDFGLPMVALQDFVGGGIADVNSLLRSFDRQRVARRVDVERGRVGLNFVWLR